MMARIHHELVQWRSLFGLITLLLSAGCGGERIRLGGGPEPQADPGGPRGHGASSSNRNLRCAGKLFGLSAFGSPNEWHSVHVDLATGATTRLAHDPRVVYVDTAGTFDPGTGLVYTSGVFRDGGSGVLTYDVATGALLAVAHLDSVTIEVDRDGRLLGVASDVGTFHFGVLDSVTGAFQTLSPLPPVASLTSRTSAYDPSRNLFYQPVYVTPGQPNLFAFDASTGTVALSTPSEELGDLTVDASGRLVGLVRSPAGWRVSFIDQLSGKSTPISQTTFSIQLGGATAIDPEAGIFLIQTYDDLTQIESTVSVWAVDTATGDVQKLVTLERPLYALELIESCRSQR
jgi:hypothetical protein